MPPAAAVEAASLRLGAFALRDLTLTVERGEVLVLLGPNGAGKSVSLEMIAGFHRPRRGRILIGGRDVTRLPPERRAVGLVVQDFGLFPHLTVAGNVAFARPQADVAAFLARFGIAPLADRLPGALSTGEKQRTALARALAARAEVLLLDEPFSALDARSRAAVRGDLKALLRGGGIAAIFVTHDPEDACALADRVAVMRAGAIVQTGSSDAVFRRPADCWIAEFVGVETMVPGRVVGRVDGGCRVIIGATVLHASRAIDAGEVLVCIRAEDVDVCAADPADPPAANRLPGQIAAVTAAGAWVRVALDCGVPLTALLTARQARQMPLVPGREIVARIDPDAVHLLPRAG